MLEVGHPVRIVTPKTDFWDWIWLLCFLKCYLNSGIKSLSPPQRYFHFWLLLRKLVPSTHIGWLQSSTRAKNTLNHRAISPPASGIIFEKLVELACFLAGVPLFPLLVYTYLVSFSFPLRGLLLSLGACEPCLRLSRQNQRNFFHPSRPPSLPPLPTLLVFVSLYGVVCDYVIMREELVIVLEAVTYLCFLWPYHLSRYVIIHFLYVISSFMTDTLA